MLFQLGLSTRFPISIDMSCDRYLLSIDGLAYDAYPNIWSSFWPLGFSIREFKL